MRSPTSSIVTSVSRIMSNRNVSRAGLLTISTCYQNPEMDTFRLSGSSGRATRSRMTAGASEILALFRRAGDRAGDRPEDVGRGPSLARLQAEEPAIGPDHGRPEVVGDLPRPGGDGQPQRPGHAGQL